MKALMRLVLLACLMSAIASPVLSGAKIRIDDDAEIDLGFRVQAFYVNTDRDLDDDGTWDSFDDFLVRRGRFRLGATINEHVSIFMQSEILANDVQLVDAYVNVKVNDWSQFVAGINMAPASRQNLTSSGALMAVDRPATAYKPITWGGVALHTFTSRFYEDSDSGFRGSNQVRDVGLTFFGSGELGDQAHIKYYYGIYDGVQTGTQDSERTTARVQLNLFDAEPGYYNSSTYLGAKKTVAFGLSTDMQSDVATGTDYSYTSADVFVELPTGNGTAFTGEAAWSKLDFDDVPGLLNSQGDGLYVQAGYLVNRWQPWFLYETWSSDAVGEVGSFKEYRVGVTYFLRGHNANLKLGYEKFKADAPFSTTSEDTINSILLGVFTTF